MPRELAAVIFDLDDTLHDDTRAYQAAASEVADGIAREHGIDSGALLAAYIAEAQQFWKGMSAEHLTMQIADTRVALWSTALAAVGIGDERVARRAVELYAGYRRKHYAPFPGALELLVELRGRGLKLGLITNGFASTHREKLALLGFEGAFDAIVIADEVGMVKPDPRIFFHACALLGVAPERTAMVGDRYFRDVVGGRQAGMFTVYLDLHGEAIPPGAPPGATVRRIDEVLAVLPLATSEAEVRRQGRPQTGGEGARKR